MQDIFVKLVFDILKNYLNFKIIFPFIPEKMKIEKSVKLLTNLHDKTACVIYIGNLKQALNHGLNFKKFHRVIKFN